MSTRPAPCGTVSAYHRHRRHNETPCAPCYEAKRVENAKRKSTNALCASCKTRQVRGHGMFCRACFELQDIGLTDGDWVIRRGIQIWVPWSSEVAA